MPYDAVLFDYDGVVMEPTPLPVLQDAVRSAFSTVGVDPSDAHVRDHAIHVEYDTVLETCDHYDLDPETFWHARDTAFTDHQTALLERGGKGLYDDHDAIHDISLPLDIVSSNQQATLEHHLEHANHRSLHNHLRPRTRTGERPEEETEPPLSRGRNGRPRVEGPALRR